MDRSFGKQDRRFILRSRLPAEPRSPAIGTIPVTPSGADLVATDSALASVHDAQVARKDGGPLCLLVPSKVDRRTATGRELAAALERFDDPGGRFLRWGLDRPICPAQ